MTISHSDIYKEINSSNFLKHWHESISEQMSHIFIYLEWLIFENLNRRLKIDFSRIAENVLRILMCMKAYTRQKIHGPRSYRVRIYVFSIHTSGTQPVKCVI